MGSEIELKNIKPIGDQAQDDPPPYLSVGKNNNAYQSDSTLADSAVSVDMEDNNNTTTFTPRQRRTNNNNEDEEEEEEAPEFEDIDPPDSSALRGLKRMQDGAGEGWENHKCRIKGVFYAALIILYFVYFGFAMAHSIEGEDAIRLLWVTVVVVAVWLLLLLWRRFGASIKECTQGCRDAIEPHGMKINWAILAILYVAIIVYVIVDVALISKEPYNLVSLAGILLYVIVCFVTSYSPAHVNWRTVLWGLALQFVMAMLILRTQWGFEVFQWLGARVDEFLTHTDAGSRFIFGDKFTDHFFAFKVLPVVIFFSTAISVLYYLGWMQAVIRVVAWVMQICMGTTAAESLNAAGNIFIGQSEAPLMIRPLIKDMTRSEIHAVMTGGFATIAGSVLAAYISFGVPANHLISASVMSAPAALAMSKLFYPETQKSKTTSDHIKSMEASPDRNIIEAASSGASASIALVANIAANLIAFLAVLAFVNASLSWFGYRVGLDDPPLTLEFICSYVLFPFALVMGVDLYDCRKVAKLIGIKTILNEFVGYDFLGQLNQNILWYNNATSMNMTTEFEGQGVWLFDGARMVNESSYELRAGQAVFDGDNFQDVYLRDGIMTSRSVVISTYALCGFANFGSMGVMLGALGAMAPQRKSDFSRVVVRAMIAGNVACFMTASIAGLFYQENISSAFS